MKVSLEEKSFALYFFSDSVYNLDGLQIYNSEIMLSIYSSRTAYHYERTDNVVCIDGCSVQEVWRAL